MAGFCWYLTAFQQPGQLRLKLQSINGISKYLRAADAGFDDFIQQGKACAEGVRAFDGVVSLDDLLRVAGRSVLVVQSPPFLNRSEGCNWMSLRMTTV